MTDKEIIIDGADVSKCGFFHPEYDTDCHIALAFSDQYEGCMKCENNPNCYFKQLKRAELKLEKIKTNCNETLSTMNAISGTNIYAGGRCIEAKKILQIIEGEENGK